MKECRITLQEFHDVEPLFSQSLIYNRLVDAGFEGYSNRTLFIEECPVIGDMARHDDPDTMDMVISQN